MLRGFWMRYWNVFCHFLARSLSSFFQGEKRQTGCCRYCKEWRGVRVYILTIFCFSKALDLAHYHLAPPSMEAHQKKQYSKYFFSLHLNTSINRLLVLLKQTISPLLYGLSPSWDFTVLYFFILIAGSFFLLLFYCGGFFGLLLWGTG